MGSIESPTKEDFAKDYKTYPPTAEDGFKPFHEARVGPIAYEIPLGSRVLDIGCNDGEFVKLLREKRDCDAHGIDPSEVAIAKANEKGQDTCIIGDAEHIPFSDGSFDFVTCMEVLVHLYDPTAVLKEIRRVLKPEGVLLGSTPHKNLERHIWDDKRLHRRYMDEKDLRDLLEPVFPAVHVRTLTGAQFALGMATSFLGTEPAELLFKAGADGTRAWEADLMSDDKLRVWFGYTQLGGTVYYRMLGYADKMEKADIAQPAWERAAWEQIDEKSRHWQANIHSKIVQNQLEQILRVAHVSVWQIVSNKHCLAFLRCASDLARGPWYKATGERKAFVTEIDDHLFDVPGYNIASHPYHPNSEMEWIALEQIKLSDAVICSTGYLQERIKSMWPDKKVYLVPNSIDFDIWDNLKPDVVTPTKPSGTIRIGYTGCSNHRGDIEMIRDPLCAILSEFPETQFIFTPQPDPEGLFMGWQGVPNIACVAGWVPIDKYPNYVSGWDLDIGIAPLLDNAFNRAKSNLRWLEYSALRIPTIASWVYPFKNSIRNYEDGLICNTKQEWYDALKGLILDEARRIRLGEAAYRRVKSDFNMAAHAKRYASILEEVRRDANRT